MQTADKKRVTIRVADMKRDALAVIDGAKDFASRVSFGSLFPKGDKFVEAVGNIVLMDGVEILVADHDGLVVGGIGIWYAPFMWNPSLLVGTELFWWAQKNAPFRTGRILFDETMKRIDERGALPMFRSLDTSPRGVAKLYQRNGLFPVETVFMRTA